MEEVVGSIPTRSTNSLTLKRLPLGSQAERGCLKRAVDVSATALLIGESQIIQGHVVRILLVIAVHLKIDGYAVPVSARAMTECPVQVAGLSVQSNGLIRQMIV